MVNLDLSKIRAAMERIEVAIAELDQRIAALENRAEPHHIVEKSPPRSKSRGLEEEDGVAGS